ncbi:hypothetical protein EZH22_15570 [Xanthobacter dioxanivorans]|uniref:Uncharacterized protein n=1 Tax=Xanthobacter dioxanivorans TaxID=2528964 RepID=A0A974PJA5_9HYPH|nr:hypothetical protein [Xanthobacter dioxanivorans]QRG04603.1 hypothetical protein EZH22_15570 [Xanthobacter dioxanivorans]
MAKVIGGVDTMDGPEPHAARLACARAAFVPARASAAAAARRAIWGGAA